MSNSKRSAGKIVGFTILGLFVFFLISGGCFFLGLVTSSIGGLGGKPSAFSSTGNAIYEIRLEGTISASSTAGLLEGAAITPEYIIDQLTEAQKNANVRAILLRINSGGGSAAASQEIFEELKKVDKPVVVSVSDICASGAYYIAVAADKIIANRSSSVGSIGVIMQIPNLEELYKKVGIKYATIKQGKYKDVGSSDRPITAEEEQLLRDQTFKIYEQFIKDVSDSRKIPIQKVREIATGWVYLGTEALDLGLIDSIGTYKDAEKLAAQLGGIKGEPVIISSQQNTLIDRLLSYYFSQAINKIINLKAVQQYPEIN
ncbi:MAG: signal peptide peptidase SppA [Actinobacteria bacterium]|nr:signal peptide peptidase SppA [Actinomycetota bacterium]